MVTRYLYLVLIALSLTLSGCGQPLEVGDETYPTYGFLNEDSDKSKNVCYETSTGNVVLSVVLVETLVAPVYFVGFSIFNPVRMKKGIDDDCSFDD